MLSSHRREGWSARWSSRQRRETDSMKSCEGNGEMDGGNKVRQKKKELALWNPKLPRRFAICISADLLAGKRNSRSKEVSRTVRRREIATLSFSIHINLKDAADAVLQKQPADLCLLVSASFPHLTFLCITMSMMSICWRAVTLWAVFKFQLPQEIRLSQQYQVK